MEAEQRAPIKHVKRRSYTKRLLGFFATVAVILTAATLFLAFRHEPDYNALSAMESLTIAWLGGTSVFTGFYCWKSKNENRAKYGQLFIRELAEKHGIEAAARFYEITVKGD